MRKRLRLLMLQTAPLNGHPMLLSTRTSFSMLHPTFRTVASPSQFLNGDPSSIIVLSARSKTNQVLAQYWLSVGEPCPITEMEMTSKVWLPGLEVNLDAYP